MPETNIDKATPPVSQPGQYSLQGNLVLDNELPAAGITARLYTVGFGGQDAKLGEAKSDTQSNYSFSYSPQTGSSPNIQVRVLDSSGKEVTISSTKFNAKPAETVNLIVPFSVEPLEAEFQRLATDLEKSIGRIAMLSQAQEGAARQDLSLLNQSTHGKLKPFV